ncbi:uncharacterized protein TRUGW13939_04986, partial [Talaromyces rugulosus]
MGKRKRASCGVSTPVRLTKDRISSCEAIIGYSFINIALLIQALNMSTASVRFEDSWIHVPKNDRLAVYGNSVAESYLCRMWMKRALTKGQWTEIRSSVLGNKNLTRVGFENGLDDCVKLNGGTMSVSANSMATTVEAIMGAVHLDGGDAALATAMMELGLTEHEYL